MSQSYSCSPSAESLWASHAESKHPTPPMHQHRRTAGPAYNSVLTRFRKAPSYAKLSFASWWLRWQLLSGLPSRLRISKQGRRILVTQMQELHWNHHITCNQTRYTVWISSINRYSSDFSSSQTAAKILPASWLLARWSKRRLYQP